MAKRTRFDANALRDFLKNGWLLAFEADQILVGWGEWSESAKPPEESFPSERQPERLSAPQSAQCTVYAPDFYLNDPKPWKATANWDIVSRGHFANHFLTGIGRNVNCEPLNWREPLSEDFANCWQKIQEGFRDRGLKKAVPVVFASATVDFSRTKSHEGLLGQILTQALELPSHLSLYGMWSENTGLFGATPEVLFSRDSVTAPICTMALAGTRGKSRADDREVLFNDPKERHEHQLVVDDLKGRLGTIGDVTVDSTQILELPTLFHLVTPVKACLPAGRNISFEDLVRLLHPTPALGVAPRALGFGEIRRWDPLAKERQRFGAPFGVTWQGRHHCVVAIRNVQWQGNSLKLGSGCGVVGESEFSREWSELGLKRESVKRMLGL